MVWKNIKLFGKPHEFILGQIGFRKMVESEVMSDGLGVHK